VLARRAARRDRFRAASGTRHDRVPRAASNRPRCLRGGDFRRQRNGSPSSSASARVGHGVHRSPVQDELIFASRLDEASAHRAAHFTACLHRRTLFRFVPEQTLAFRRDAS
jgi:hypothetical protein